MWGDEGVSTEVRFFGVADPKALVGVVRAGGAFFYNKLSTKP